MTITTKFGRSAVLAALTGAAAAVALLAPAAASAAPARTTSFTPGYLALSRQSGSLDDNPVAAYYATKACPAADRAYAQVALDNLDGTFIDSLSAGFTPTDKAPRGQLDAGSLRSQVTAHDLTTGYYRTDLLCYNDDFTQTVVTDVNAIRIDVEHNTFKVFDGGYVALSKHSGTLDDNPVSAYKTTKACPAANRAYAQVALDQLDGTFIDSLSAGFTPTSTAPSGQLDAGSLQAQVRGHDLTTGYYLTDLLCYNDDFTSVVVADVNVIKIDVEHNKFYVYGYEPK